VSAVVPLALLWFGQSEAAMLFVVIMGTLWSVLIAVDNGARSLPPIYVRAARTMGSSGLHTLAMVILPASLPFVVSGMKQGWAFAWRSLMAAEIYVTLLTGYGLGHLLHFGRELNAMDQVIGVMLVIILIGLAADKALFSPWERFLHRRWAPRHKGSVSSGINPLAAHPGLFHLNIFHLVHGARKDVAVDHDEVGQLAWLQ